MSGSSVVPLRLPGRRKKKKKKSAHTHTEILTNIQKKRKGVKRSNKQHTKQHTPYTKTAGTQSIETNLCQMRRHYISQQNLTDDRKHKESAPSLMGCWKDPQLLSSS